MELTKEAFEKILDQKISNLPTNNDLQIAISTSKKISSLELMKLSKSWHL